ncbi:MAG: hypothetical protein CMQ33_09200 [Gammaproteobacteria bacterium]|nr:hypothetical protein [Gammaproteobacteria bacterium]
MFSAKRVSIITASGGHNLLFIAPRDSAKTMLAGTLRTLIPEVSASTEFAKACFQYVSNTSLTTRPLAGDYL